METAQVCFNCGLEFYEEDKYEEAIDWFKGTLTIYQESGDQEGIAKCYMLLGGCYQQLEKYSEASDYYKQCLTTDQENENQERIGNCFFLLGECYRKLEKYFEAIDNYEICLGLYISKDYHEGIARCNDLLGNCYLDLNNCSEAVSNYQQSLSTIINHNLDTHLEGHVCQKLGLALMDMNRYQDSKQYLDKTLIIAKQIGDRKLELRCNRSLCNLSIILCEYDSAVNYGERALSIANEIDSTEEKHYAYDVLGNALSKIGRKEEAIWYYERYLRYAKETGDRNEEIIVLCNISLCYYDIHNYDRAISFGEECLTIGKETGDMKMAYRALGSVGVVLQEKGQVKKAIEYHVKFLQYAIQMNDKYHQATANNNLGTAYMALCKHYKAIDYLQTSLKLYSELGIETRNYNAYNNLGVLYYHIGNYQEAVKYYGLCFDLVSEPGQCKTTLYNFSGLYNIMEEFELAREYRLESIIYYLRAKDKQGEVRYFQELGASFRKNTQSYKARFYHNKALQLAQETQNSQLVEECYVDLAATCAVFGQIDEAIGFYQKALADSGDLNHKAECCYKIAYLYKCRLPNQETTSVSSKESETYLRDAIEYYEEVFADLREKHDLKITIVDTYIKAYKALALLLIETGRLSEALLVCDRGRACTLRDTLVSQYEMENNQLLVDDFIARKLLDEKDIQNLLSSERSLLFLAILEDDVHSWILSQNNSLKYVQNDSNANNVLPNVAEIIEYILSQSTSTKSLTKLLKKLFQHLITPIKEDLFEDEVVIVPEGNLYTVPFAALQDPQTGRYFCESKRIRIVPSLTTMKIFKECPPDYHCSKGALVVGNPSVGEVIFRGERKIVSSLVEAEREACVSASILVVEPVIGSSATKEAVKEKIKEGAAVIHIAAHGDNITGEIFLAPGISAQTKAIPEEEDYILTMQEVQEIGVRAKLVVLSCCHSGRGEIRAEGVIGMARAFLAAGARVVVASLWAISDEATLDFMSGFYYHLRKGESASKSLNESMKELIREKTYSHPKYWAPFVLIGDDVTIF